MPRSTRACSPARWRTSTCGTRSRCSSTTGSTRPPVRRACATTPACPCPCSCTPPRAHASPPPFPHRAGGPGWNGEFAYHYASNVDENLGRVADSTAGAKDRTWLHVMSTDASVLAWARGVPQFVTTNVQLGKPAVAARQRALGHDDVRRLAAGPALHLRHPRHPRRTPHVGRRCASEPSSLIGSPPSPPLWLIRPAPPCTPCAGVVPRRVRRRRRHPRAV